MILTGDIGADRLKEVQASQVPFMDKPCDVDELYEFLEKASPSQKDSIADLPLAASAGIAADCVGNHAAVKGWEK